jgi:hypothetical protein
VVIYGVYAVEWVGIWSLDFVISEQRERQKITTDDG